MFTWNTKRFAITIIVFLFFSIVNKALASCGFKRSYVKLTHYISTTTMSMATKLGRVVSCHEGLPTIMLHDSLNM